MLNTPGTVIRSNDDSLSAVYGRLVATELTGSSIRGSPVFVANVFERIVRGKEISLIHWVELENASQLQQLVDVDQLPEDVVPTDRARIAMAASHFRAYR